MSYQSVTNPERLASKGNITEDFEEHATCMQKNLPPVQISIFI